MKKLSFLVCIASFLSVPAAAETAEEAVTSVIEQTCVQNGKKYAHQGMRFGITEPELGALGNAEIKKNYPSSGSSSVALGEKTLAIWSTPNSPDQPLYRIDYSRGAVKTPFTMSEAQTFTEERIAAYGEPKIKSAGKGYHNEGFPQLNYSADQQVKNEKFQSVKDCLSQHREISIYEQMDLENFKPRNYKSAYQGLQKFCPDQVDAYHDYMVYSLQPEVNVQTGTMQFHISMTCPAYNFMERLKFADQQPARQRRR